MNQPSAREAVAVSGLIVTSYALIDHEEGSVVLVDGGFLGDAVGRIRRELEFHELGWRNVEAIVLSHGHLDHTRNIARLRRETGAPVFAPRIDAAHIEGRYPYRGLSRFCGWIETVGRCLLRYEAPEIDHWFEPGDELPFWGGLRVVGLPGHTLGHCGFYSEPERLLLAGDLFSNFLGFAKPPPPWFNVDGQRVWESIRLADEIVPLDGGVLLNHPRDASPQWHREDLARLAARSRRDVSRKSSPREQSPDAGPE